MSKQIYRNRLIQYKMYLNELKLAEWQFEQDRYSCNALNTPCGCGIHWLMKSPLMDLPEPGIWETKFKSKIKNYFGLGYTDFTYIFGPMSAIKEVMEERPIYPRVGYDTNNFGLNNFKARLNHIIRLRFPEENGKAIVYSD